MRYEILYSQAALDDLDRIWSEVFMACRDLSTTSTYINALLKEIASYARFPESGAPINYLKRWTGYRFIRYKAYMAIYHLDGQSMMIDMVAMARSDYISRLLHLRT